jgi:Kef-type K+ transport system membrane component KefB
MTKKKRNQLIIAIIVGTPILSALFLAVVTAVQGSDQAGIGAAFGLVFGIFASVVSLVLGPAVSFLTRHMKDQKYSLTGYIIPPALLLVYLIVNLITS